MEKGYISVIQHWNEFGLNIKTIYSKYKMLRGLLLASLAIFGIAQNSVSIKNCSPESEFSITALDFSPTTPIIGQNGTLHIAYDVPTTIDSGEVKYSCVYNGLPILSQTDDLCKQTKCPIIAGSHDDYSISEVPKASGKVVCTIVWNKAEKELLCIEITMKLNGMLRKYPMFSKALIPISKKFV